MTKIPHVIVDQPMITLDLFAPSGVSSEVLNAKIQISYQDLAGNPAPMRMPFLRLIQFVRDLLRAFASLVIVNFGPVGFGVLPILELKSGKP
ncbi:MAG: hypothetical protein ACREJC_17665, partial [Tepidisphaeraceae bacterium]